MTDNFKTMDANEAVAHVAYRLNDVIAIIAVALTTASTFAQTSAKPAAGKTLTGVVSDSMCGAKHMACRLCFRTRYGGSSAATTQSLQECRLGPGENGGRAPASGSARSGREHHGSCRQSR